MIINDQMLIVSKKYARAFINLFYKKLTLNDIMHLHACVVFIKKRKQMLFYVQLSFLEHDKVKAILLKLLNNFALDSLFENLIEVLIADKRVFLLPAIFTYIISLYQQRAGIMKFMITSSHELDKGQLNMIESYLKQVTRKTILYETKINKKLIAGIKLYSDTFGLEHSVRKQLIALSHIY